MADQKVGVVSHYYNHLGVAVVDVSASFSQGDTLKFVRKGEELFQQQAASIQVEHSQVEKTEKGMSVGLKVDKLVHEGVEVFKVIG